MLTEEYTRGMATGTTKAKPPRGGKLVGYDDFVDRELARVRSYVKLSDVAGQLLGLAAVVLMLLFALVVVDHWIVDLGVWGRLAGCVSLVVVVAYGLLRRVLPMCLRQVNPEYAAWLVEQYEPGLRNSLINFVMLRARQHELRPAVYQQVQRQAATRLQHAEVDAAIDQTPLIRLALALLASICIIAVYTFLSPKSPFASAARVLRPFRTIARPTAVRIFDVRPGDVSIYAGQPVSVSARVEHPRDDPQVWLVTSTPDGRSGERRTLLVRDDQGVQFVGTIAENSGGVEQDIDYRVESGDAVAGPFRVRVSPAPAIFVEEIRYEPPPYTLREPRVVRDNGDIEALEGTRVTIVARANQEIRHARVEFDPDQQGETPRAAKRLTMDHEGRRATATFVLQLKEDRKSPVHSTYQLWFTSADGQTNAAFVHYAITVTPDLSPLVEILTPGQLRVSLPENRDQMIEVRAVDPDFGLSDIRLQAVAKNEKLLDLPLLDRTPAVGQQVRRYRFQPSRYGLKSGDVMLFRGLARDNREDRVRGTASPNSAITSWYAIQIVDPQTGGAGTSEADSDADADAERMGDAGGGPDAGESQDSTNGSGGAEDSADSAAGEAGENTAGGSSGEGAGPGEDASTEQGTSGEGTAGEASESEGSSGEEASGNSSTGGDPTGSDGEPREAPGDDGSAGGGAQSDPNGQGDADAASTENGSGGEEAGNAEMEASDGSGGDERPEAGGEGDTQNTGASEGTRDGGNKGESRDRDADGESADAASDDEPPVSSDGTEDGDALERMVDRLREKYGERDAGIPDVPDSAESDGADAQNGESSAAAPSESTDDASGSGATEDGASAGDTSVRDTAQEGTTDEGTSQEGASPDPGGTSQEGASDGSEGGSDGSEGGSDQGAEGDTPADEGETSESEAGGDLGDDASAGDDADDAPSDDQNASDGDGDTSAETNARNDAAPSDTDASRERANSGDASSATSQAAGASSSGDATAEGEPGNGEARAIRRDETPVDNGGREAGGSDPNLEYAREVTDLVLERLAASDADRRDMQKELGWSSDEMDAFVRRWQELRAGARETAARGDTAEEGWDDALRSLGLRRPSPQMRAVEEREDSGIAVSDGGTRVPPPREYAEQYEAYLRSLGKPQLSDRRVKSAPEEN